MIRPEQRCLDHGLRITPQRRVILHVLEAACGHPSVEEIHRSTSAPDPRISLATVYRTLNMLTDAGLLSRVIFNDHKAHYEGLARIIMSILSMPRREEC